MRVNVNRIAPVAAVLAAGLAGGALAQGPVEQPDMTITPGMRTETIDNALKALNEGYIFADKAKAMETAVREHARNGDYDSVTSGKEFAKRLTDDLQAVSHDKHLRVRFDARGIPVTTDSAPSPQERAHQAEQAQKFNYGFEKVERLGGNVGYLDLRGFLPPDLAGETCAAAMAFLANTDALIIDLRYNGGGEPEMVALLCSYFFGGEPVHLNDLYYRAEDRTQQYWTLPYVPGKKYLDKDVYVLTSHRTFSGAEECTYNLKNLKRAIIVGETTGGGAHPGDMRRLSEHFAMFLPMGRAINPITKTNWEGTGVTPDIAVPADLALKTAQLDALKRIQARTTDGERKALLGGAIEQVQKELDGLKKG